MILAGDHWPQTHLAPRSGEREGPGAERREGEGHFRHVRSVMVESGGLLKLFGHEISIDPKPLTFPLLRNEPFLSPLRAGLSGEN